VGILEIHEEEWVEPAERLEERAADDERGPGDGRNNLRLDVASGRLAESAAGGNAGVMGRVAAGVYPLRMVGQEDLGGSEAGVWIGLEGCYQPRDPAGPADDVLIDHGQILGLGGGRAEVIGCAIPKVGALRHQADGGKLAPDDGEGAVGRGVI